MAQGYVPFSWRSKLIQLAADPPSSLQLNFIKTFEQYRGWFLTTLLSWTYRLWDDISAAICILFHTIVDLCTLIRKDHHQHLGSHFDLFARCHESLFQNFRFIGDSTNHLAGVGSKPSAIVESISRVHVFDYPAVAAIEIDKILLKRLNLLLSDRRSSVLWSKHQWPMTSKDDH